MGSSSPRFGVKIPKNLWNHQLGNQTASSTHQEAGHLHLDFSCLQKLWLIQLSRNSIKGQRLEISMRLSGTIHFFPLNSWPCLKCFTNCLEGCMECVCLVNKMAAAFFTNTRCAGPTLFTRKDAHFRSISTLVGSSTCIQNTPSCSHNIANGCLALKHWNSQDSQHTLLKKDSPMKTEITAEVRVLGQQLRLLTFRTPSKSIR